MNKEVKKMKLKVVRKAPSTYSDTVSKELTLGSLFDGLGGWQLAAVNSGIKPIWSSEIEKFPMDITKKWFPNTIQLGDITKLDGAEIPPVDIICAGSPCQDLSIAGKRAGLEGERSGLFRKAVDIVQGMQKATNGEYPRYFVWENVPGAFSSNKGQDFRSVLEEIGQTNIPMPPNDKWTTSGLVECKECEIAWRVLDAQYWGVPQRRKRVFLVADFAKTRRCAGKILFVEQSLSGHIKKDERERESSLREVTDSSGNAEQRMTLSETPYEPCADIDGKSVYENQQAYENRIDEGVRIHHDIVPTIKAAWGTGGGNVPMILDDEKYGIEMYSMANGSHTLEKYGTDISPTLTSRMGTGGNQVPVFVVNKNRANTLRANAEPQIVGTLTASDSKGKNGQDINKFPVVESRIRRLTPLECERLQGLPDGWTDVPGVDKKGNIKPASDSSRYKAIGNGMAQPCADFVLRQIAYYDRVSENEVESSKSCGM